MISTGKALAGAAVAMLLVVAGLAATAAPAQAGCEICDQYTLDIPEPQDNGGGSSGSGSGDSPSGGEPAPAPVAPPAPVEPAPVAPVEPAPVASAADERDRDKPKPKPDPEPIVTKVDVYSGDPALPESTPLEYDESASASEAALAGLGSPGTVALLIALIAAGAAVAIGRRRASG